MASEDFVIRSGAVADVPARFKAHWEDAVPLVVADHNTWKAAGKAVADSFTAAGIEAKVFIFPDESVYADDDHIATVRREMERTGTIGVAVGGGTINDLVKRASEEMGQAYMVVPTASSVDGYTAYGASITVQGFKTTLPCAAPVAVVADTDVLCNAPSPMIASGYGDLSAKITAGADWIIADALGVEPIQKDIWDMVQKPLRGRIGNPEKIAARNPEAIKNLFMGLVEVGYAMQRYKDSRPASGSDHLLSHVWEMEHLSVNGVAVSHGFKVAIGTLCSTAMLTEFTKLSADDVKQSIEKNTNPPYASWYDRQREIDRYLHVKASIKDPIVKASRIKFQEGPALEKRQEDILRQWDTMMNGIKKQIIPFPEIQKMFKIAGCPIQPADISLSREDVARAMRVAQMIRKRYTGLDLAYEAGLLDRMIGIIVDSNTYFTDFRA